MSANLLAEGDRRDGTDGTTYADGVWSIPANGTSKDKNAANDWPTGTEAVTENQTLHVGLSVRAASGASVVVAPGVAYVDGAGNVNYVATRVSARGTGAWQRVEGSFVMPSGMRVSFLFVHQGAGGAALELTAPCLSYGSPVCLAISSTTLAWSAGIVATTRYYKLASATSSTPAVPTSSSALNGWSETEPTSDVTKVMWVCERTVYADGTESWSKASKSTSYEAAKDAKSAANAAKNTADSAKSAADNLKTLIHEGDDGITVGKSADGKTWSTGRTRMTADSYQILDKLGTVITQLASDGASFLSGLVRIVTGKATLPGNKTVNSIVIDAGDGVAALHGIISRLNATINGIASSVSAGWEQDFGCGVTAIVRESATVASAAYLASDKAELHVCDNHVTMTGGGFELSRPDAMRSAIGLGMQRLYYDYDAGWVVYASDYLVWIYAWGVTTGSDSWGSKTCPYVLPEKYRPKLSHITTPVITNNGGSWTGSLAVKSDGTITVSNRGNAGSTDSRYGLLCYPVGV